MDKSSEIKNCQNCKKDFVIEQEDFKFYEKIKVPPPTFCPECRAQRRMSWRNVRNLYKRNDNFSSNKIISVYSKDIKLKIVEQKEWHGDGWDPLSFGMEYDFSKSFFEQFNELLKNTPLPNISTINCKNSEYVNMLVDSKNCYLVFSSSGNQDCCYSEGINNCQNCYDVLSSFNNNYICESINCNNSFNLTHSLSSSNCIDSSFLYDCNNCSSCFGCWNLRNKKYCIFNEQFSREEYFKKINLFNLGSYKNRLEIRNIYNQKVQKSIRKFANIVKSENVTGDDIQNSKNCFNVFDISESLNSKYVWRTLGGKSFNSYDISVGLNNELCYESCGVGLSVSAYNTSFAIGAGDSSYCSYIQFCLSGCKNLFGCVGLKNKSYCILNKQYTKEEYEELVPKIIKHMNDMPYIDSKGRIYKYGEFFPSELSPFCYNETIAQEYFPLTKEQALEQGYKWKEKEERNYTIDIKNEDIPDDISNVSEDIINKVIECHHSTSSWQVKNGECNEQCTEAFKIIEAEYQFYKRMNLPLPRLCPNCRHYQRLKQRNPLKLWHRKCMKPGCTNEFETSYAPERPEVVYCERCYQNEVY